MSIGAVVPWVTKTKATPVVDSSPVFKGIEIGVYSQQLGVATVPVGCPTPVWTITGGNLPLTLNLSSNGLLAGSFGADGTFTAEITITSGSTATIDMSPLIRVFAFVVGDGDPTTPKTAVKPLLDRALLPVAQLNEPFVHALGLASMPYAPPGTFTAPTWAILSSTLPGSPSLNATTGVLTVTFTADGDYLVKVRISSTSATVTVEPLDVLFTIHAGAGGSGGTATPPPPPGEVTTPLTPPVAPPPPPPVITVTQSVTVDEWIVTKTAADNGAGLLLPTQNSAGRIDYANSAIYFPPADLYTYKKWNRNDGTWTQEELTDTFAAASQVSVTYRRADVNPTSAVEILPAQKMLINLKPYSTDTVVPGTVQFQIGDTIYEDNEGVISHTVNPTTGVGTPCGTLDYVTGIAELSSWVAGSAAFTLLSLATMRGTHTETEFYFRTTGSPLRPAGFQIAALALDGELITASADLAGDLIGADAEGVVDTEFGLVDVRFGAMVLDSSLTEDEKLEDWYDIADVGIDGYIWKPRKVIPQTARYNCVVYAYLPLDADILGIDAVRLPSDGRVPIYRTGGVVMVIHPLTTSPATPALNGGTGNYELSCGRTRIAWVRVVDAAGAVVTEGYTLDRAAGIVAWTTLVGLAVPVTVEHTVGDLRLITDVQIDGTLTLSRPLSHPFPADDSLVCACLIHGDRRARVSAVWDQASWDSTWQDAIVGSASTGTLNTIDFPITVTNEGCDTDRWLLRWLSTTTAELISERRGLVWTGSYPAYVSGDPVDIAPINPRTRTLVDGVYAGGVPYLTIPQRANGGGWSAGNVVRINTVGAIADFWIARSVGQSDEPLDDGADGCEIYALGNVDRP